MAAPSEATVCFVLNGGDPYVLKGGITAAGWEACGRDASKVMEPNGAIIGGGGLGDYDQFDIEEITEGPYAGKVRIYDFNESRFTDVTIEDLVAYVAFYDVYESGYYRVARETSSTVILPDVPYSLPTTCDIYVGGAFNTIATAHGTDIMDAASYNRTCYVRGNVAATPAITLSNAGGVDSRAFWLGATDTWAEQPIGSYVTLNGNGAIATCLTVYGDYITIRGFYCTGATSHPLVIGGASYFYHYMVDNCKADSTATAACYLKRLSAQLTNCDFRTTHSTSGAVASATSGAIFERCTLKTASTTADCVDLARGGSFLDCIIIGGGLGVDIVSYTIWLTTIKGCIFYDQTISCGNITGSAVGVSIYNNIFWVADIVNDYAVTVAEAGILVYEGYNFTNKTTNPMLLNSVASPWRRANSQVALWSDAEANLWVNAAGGNFTPTVGSGMIDAGMPTLNGGKSTPGAVQLTQLQSGGGAGGGSIIGAGIIRGWR